MLFISSCTLATSHTLIWTNPPPAWAWPAWDIHGSFRGSATILEQRGPSSTLMHSSATE